MIDTSSQKNFIPLWIWPASAMVLLIVGGAFLDWYSNHDVDVPSGALTPSEVQFAETGTKDPARMPGRRIPSATVSNGEIDGHSGRAMLSAGEYHLQVIAPIVPPYYYTYSVDRKAVFAPDDLKLIELIRRLLTVKGLDPKLVPPDFIQQLHDKFADQITTQVVDIKVADDDQKSIDTLFTQYLDAKETARPAIAAQLLQALQAAGVAAVQNQSANFAAIAQSAHEMIPPDKQQACRQAFRELNHPANTQPPVHVSAKVPLQATRPATQPSGQPATQP